MHVTRRAMLAAAATLLLAAGGGAADHEIPGDRSAKDILPAAMLKGANYKGRDVVPTDGYTDRWTVDSDFGVFGAARRGLDCSWMGAVVAERLMWACRVVVREVSAQQAPEMPFVERDEVVEALPPDGADEALGERILSGRVGRDEDLLNPHVSDTTLEDVAIDGISVAEQILRRRVLRKRLHDLLGGPGGGRVVCDIELQEFPLVMAEDDEGEEHSKGEGGNEEEVDGHDLREMRFQEDAPTRGGARRRPAHVLGHGERGDIVAEESEFGLNAAPAPSGIVTGHATDQMSDLGVDRWTAERSRSELPAPIELKPLAVPGEDCRRLDDEQA